MRRENWLYIGFAVILGLLVITFVSSDNSYWGPCRGWSSPSGEGMHHRGMHRGEPEFFGIGFYGFGLLFWILVIFFIVLVFLNSRRQEPIDLLKKRYANGEITLEEFRKMKEELSRK